MSTSTRTDVCKMAGERIASAAALNTATHTSAAHNRKYLQMKAAQAANPDASCRTCIRSTPKKYVIWCKMWSHVVKAGNICEEFKK